MLFHMLDDPTFAKLTANATSLSLRYNHQPKMQPLIPPDYNQSTVLRAYEDAVEKRLNKETFFQALSAMMQVLEEEADEELGGEIGEETVGTIVALQRAFKQQSAKEKMRYFAEFCLGESFDEEKCWNCFMPQLAFFFLRYLDVYDGALQGMPANDYLADLKRRQNEERLRDERTIKNVWENVKNKTATPDANNNAPKPEASTVEKTEQTPKPEENDKEEIEQQTTNKKDDYEIDEEQVESLLSGISLFNKQKQSQQQQRRQNLEKNIQKQAGAKNELHYLEKSAERGRQLLLEYCSLHRERFLRIWTGLKQKKKEGANGNENDQKAKIEEIKEGAENEADEDDEDEEALMEEDRELILKESRHPKELASNHGVSFVQLLSFVLNNDPQQVKVDPFVEQFILSRRRKEEGAEEGQEQKKKSPLEVSMEELITVSRRFVLLTFVSKVVSNVMGTPFDDLAPATSLLKDGLNETSQTPPTPQPSSSSSSIPPSKKNNPYLFQLETTDARKCSREQCEEFERTGGRKFQVCSFCRKIGRIVPYCSRECQAIDWKDGGHKLVCGKKPNVSPAGDGGIAERLKNRPKPPTPLPFTVSCPSSSASAMKEGKGKEKEEEEGEKERENLEGVRSRIEVVEDVEDEEADGLNSID
ncbi:hypothetical protein QOT17_008401 [Balamuthia mandrillaris]